MEFVEFPKIARLSRNCVITEKIDGTNAQVSIRRESDPETEAVREYLEFGIDTQVSLDDGAVAFVRAGSRTRWISTQDDNFGFAKWVYANAHELAKLGEGSHFGEWWGSGIQRGYGLEKGEKRFSLFNTARWSVDAVRPACCSVVPVLYSGIFDIRSVNFALDTLSLYGSQAATGFKDPEGIIIWHEAAQLYFKKTIRKDEEWKGKANAQPQREAA